MSQAVRVLEVVSAAAPNVDLKLESHDFGGCAIEKTGEPLPPSTLKACQAADAILMGTTTELIFSYWLSNVLQAPSVGQNGEWTPKYAPSQASCGSGKFSVSMRTFDQQTLHPTHYSHSLL